MQIEMSITGKTRLLGIIGNPVEHSISPQLHNTLSKELGVDLAYVPFKVEYGNLEKAINGLKAVNVIGFNVTIPYKEEMARLVDELSEEARLIGAVNTVKSADGKLYGYNTDAEGFSRSFKQETGTGFEDKNIAIVGAGGAARAIAVKIALEGARQIHIINRTFSKAYELAKLIGENPGQTIEAVESGNPRINDILAGSDIIVNTTSIGMHPDKDGYPLGNFLDFSGRQIVYDVIYNPAKTKLLMEAEKRGSKIVNGLGMLLFQGMYAYEIWTGLKIPSDLAGEIQSLFINYLKK